MRIWKPAQSSCTDYTQTFILRLNRPPCTSLGSPLPPPLRHHRLYFGSPSTAAPVGTEATTSPSPPENAKVQSFLHAYSMRGCSKGTLRRRPGQRHWKQVLRRADEVQHSPRLTPFYPIRVHNTNIVMSHIATSTHF